MSPPTTLIELLRQRASAQSASSCRWQWLDDGERAGVQLTAADLDRRARAIAARLMDANVRGERALLLCGPGLDYVTAFFGCLYAGAIAVPIPPPRGTRDATRLDRIVRDAKPRVLIGASALVAAAQPLLEASIGAHHAIAVDTIGPDERGASPVEQPIVDVHGDDVAYLQYTSGSTAQPKGVAITHRNVLENLRSIATDGAFDAESVCASWLPPFHDMGLVYGTLLPLHVGCPAILMSPGSFVQRPLRWLRAVGEWRVTHSGAPDFAYDLCTRTVSAEDLRTLDLSSWRVAFNGAEPIRAATLAAFADRFAAAGFRGTSFYPVYGLAEATLKVTAGAPGSGATVLHLRASALEHHEVESVAATDTDARAVVCCGRVTPPHELVIVDPWTCRRLSDGVVGEIWIAGPSVARGYWGRDEDTAASFGGALAEASSSTRYLRSGDLGFLRDTQLYVTGRLKDLILVHGRNHYPQDIEETVTRCHPILRGRLGVAFAVDDGGRDALVIVQEVGKHPPHELTGIGEAIVAAVADHHHVQASDVLLVPSGTIPRTSSGKRQRHACRDSYLRQTLPVLDRIGSVSRDPLAGNPWPDSEPGAAAGSAAHATAIERTVRKHVRLTGLLDRTAPLTVLGMDSITTVRLAHELSTSGLAEIDPAALGALSIAELEALATQRSVRQDSGIARTGAQTPVRATEPLTVPLSIGQRALWATEQLHGRSNALNVARALRLVPPVAIDRVSAALTALLANHSALRTTMTNTPQGPVQTIWPDTRVAPEIVDAIGWDDDAFQQHVRVEAERPFALASGEPLVRVRLYDRGAWGVCLLFVAHHIICDFWSLVLLVRELGALYARPDALVPDAPHPAPYAAHVQSEDEFLGSLEGVQHRGYWQRQLAGQPPVMHLPADRPRHTAAARRAGCLRFEIDADLRARLEAVRTDCGVTLFTALLAIFELFVHRHTGQRDLLIGVPTHGRQRAALRDEVGYFVNPLPIRTEVLEGSTGRDLVQRAGAAVADGLRHAGVPLMTMLADGITERRPEHTQPFQLLFLFLRAHVDDLDACAAIGIGAPGCAVTLGDLRIETLELRRPTTHFELMLGAADLGDRVVCHFEYDADVFDESTIGRMAARFQDLTRWVVDHLDTDIAAAPLAARAEAAALAASSAGPRRCWEEPSSVPAMFAEWVAKTPDAPAVIGDDVILNYRGLDARANELAARLVAAGIGEESVVGLIFERGVPFVVALLAVMKARAAYLPLEPSWPVARLQAILTDAGAQLVLTTTTLSRSRVPDGIPEWRLDEQAAIGLGSHLTPFTPRPAAAAYVIYTSGSSGAPKGVVVEHRQLANYVRGITERLGVSPGAAYAMVSSSAADLAHTVLFTSLCNGGALHLISTALATDPEKLSKYVETTGIEYAKLTPSHLRRLIPREEHRPIALPRCLIVGGEPLSWELVDRVRHLRPDVRILNHYGPTECTVGVLTNLLTPATPRPWARVPLGTPLPNIQTYVCDTDHGLVPAGLEGELWIGGSSVARGYLGQPSLTAERFVPDPHGTTPGARLYRTGDRCRRSSADEIEFLGRADAQVKIDGYRVELAEIERTLEEHPLVWHAAATVTDDGDDHRTLGAYVQLRVPSAENHDDVLRHHLRARLPHYAVPKALHVVERIPLTPNGKVDRRALGTLGVPEAAPAGDDAKPSTPVERELADMFRELLGPKDLTIHQSFLDLGGHSLLFTQLASRIRSAFKVSVPLPVLFRAPTIHGLTQAITEEYLRQTSAAEAAWHVQDVQRRSPREIQHLLDEIV